MGCYIIDRLDRHAALTCSPNLIVMQYTPGQFEIGTVCVSFQVQAVAVVGGSVIGVIRSVRVAKRKQHVCLDTAGVQTV